VRVDQVLSFVGQHAELKVAIEEAQTAANTWLEEHSMSVATVYSASSQSIWHNQGNGYWYHVIMLTIQYYRNGSSSPANSEQS
jgi:hypothetical protein